MTSKNIFWKRVRIVLTPSQAYLHPAHAWVKRFKNIFLRLFKKRKLLREPGFESWRFRVDLFTAGLFFASLGLCFLRS